MRTILLVVLLSSVALWSVACSLTSGDTSTTEVGVTTSTLVDDTVSASGVVEPAEWMSLSFPSGGRSLELHVSVGQSVAENDLLASIDPRPAEAAVASAKAQLADAEANLARLEDIDASDEAISAGEAAVTAAQAALGEAERGLSNTSLYAPFAGTVVEVDARSGENVAPEAPVLLLADLTTLQVKTTDLSEVDTARVSIGDAARVSFDALPEGETGGEVTEIASRSSSGSGVYYAVTIRLDELPDQLRWGMSAFAVIEVEPR